MSSSHFRKRKRWIEEPGTRRKAPDLSWKLKKEEERKRVGTSGSKLKLGEYHTADGKSRYGLIAEWVLIICKYSWLSTLAHSVSKTKNGVKNEKDRNYLMK